MLKSIFVYRDYLLNTVKMNINDRKLKFPFPSCWRNEDRVRVLCAPFRPRDINPENYDSKMAFWKNIIVEFCEFYGTAIFNISDLKKILRKENRIPECLPVVIQEMLAERKIRRLEEYEYDPLNSWSGWIVTSLVKSPLTWGWDKVKNTLDSSYVDHINYVCINAIKEFLTIIEEEVFPSNLGKVMHFDNFTKIVKDDLTITNASLKLCLLNLHLQKKVGLAFVNNDRKQPIHLVKIPGENRDIVINEQDHAVHDLQKTQESLIQQLEDLENEVGDMENKTRAYLKENKRSLAKNCLRKKKILEKKIEKRGLLLTNVESLLHSVAEAKSTDQILEVYKTGSKALQKALTDSGLQYDKVEEVLLDTQESLEAFKEIEDTISNANIDSTINDAEELEKELQALAQETKTESQVPAKIYVQPSVVYDNNNSEGLVYSPDTISIEDKDVLEMLDNLEVIDDALSVTSSVTSNETTGHKVRI